MQELSLNILDIAQNSVKAKASLIYIIIDENLKADKLTISIRDNGCGMSEEVVKRVSDPFYTTRTTRKVGLGVPFFKMAALMTDGSFDIKSTPGVGTDIVAVFTHSHIDRMPLGDVCATVCSLIQCNPDIDFIYTHTKTDDNGAAEFTLDTREFRQVLEGVPFSEPEVVTFLKEYILENDIS